MRILVLGAGFGGLELTTRLSDELGDDIDVVLIDKSDGFVFGFSKLEVMFGRTVPDAVVHPYRDLVKHGVRFVQTTVRAIDCMTTSPSAAFVRGRTSPLVMPPGVPIPPSPAASEALLVAFAERGINWHPGRLVRELDPVRKVAIFSDGSDMPYDLFLGVPVHRAPVVVEESGLCVEAGYPRIR
jgi:hypothetical protein